MTQSYHMIEYIHEAPQALARTLETNEIPIQQLVENVRRRGIQRVLLTGLGSSYTSALMAAPLFYYHCPLPTRVLSSGEIPYYAGCWIDERTLMVVISRSGERGLAVNALVDAVQRGALAVAITGVADSLLAEKGQSTLITVEGAEITFPKTKSVTACTGLLMRLALALAEAQDRAAAKRLSLLIDAPKFIQQTLEALEPAVRSLMPSLKSSSYVAVVGMGSNYGAAMEGAMKIMEAAEIATRFDGTDGLLHGPIGGLDAQSLVTALVTESDWEVSKSLLEVLRRLGTRSLCICPPGLELAGLGDAIVSMPASFDPLMAGLAYITPLHLLAYYWALVRQIDPDAPAAMQTILGAVLPPGRSEPELRKDD